VAFVQIDVCHEIGRARLVVCGTGVYRNSSCGATAGNVTTVSIGLPAPGRLSTVILGANDLSLKQLAEKWDAGVASSFNMRRHGASDSRVISPSTMPGTAPRVAGTWNSPEWREWAGTTVQSSRMPGAHSRWSAGKDLGWEPLRIEHVCEVKYDHMQGNRFRHAVFFLRWRPDRRPQDCRYDQLEVTEPYELERIFSQGSRDS
jgi:hypothetical protein